MTNPPGTIRDAVDATLKNRREGLTVAEICRSVEGRLGRSVPRSSIQSSLSLRGNSIQKTERGRYCLIDYVTDICNEMALSAKTPPSFSTAHGTIINIDCFDWIASAEERSVHAIVTDPPYGLIEYSTDEQKKLREGRGGIWRIPPTVGGCQRSPLPRFTTLTASDLENIYEFFLRMGKMVARILVPGANIVLASNPLVAPHVSMALSDAGLERRGEIVRLVQTMRGGDRPKGHENEFRNISVMPRSQWEPWLVFRNPLDGTVAENLRKWGTGGFQRISDDLPFGDVVKSHPTRKAERQIVPHPSLKPQDFMRQIVRASLPLGTGIILDPFCGGGSTIAAADAIGYRSIGIEKDPFYYEMACEGVPKLANLRV